VVKTADDSRRTAKGKFNFPADPADVRRSKKIINRVTPWKLRELCG